MSEFSDGAVLGSTRPAPDQEASSPWPGLICTRTARHRDADERPLYAARMNRTPESAGAARLLVSRALQEWELTDLQDAAWLVVSELVANAVMHAKRSTVRVTVTRMDFRTVRVAVLDRSTRTPKRREAGPDDVSGRGLELVALMCEGRWGTDRLSNGKRVWADVLMPEEKPGG